MQFEQEVPHPPGTNNVDFHRKQFLAERIGWVAMALFLLWALVGGFGDGCVSRRQSYSANHSLTMDYETFGRRDAPMQLRLQLSAKGAFSIHLNREFLDGVELERITPDYDKMVMEGDGSAILFECSPVAEVHAITIEYRPRHAGWLPVELGANQNLLFSFDQFIYP
jgi:hypothetical protein